VDGAALMGAWAAPQADLAQIGSWDFDTSYEERALNI
jgi:hypothetical protein